MAFARSLLLSAFVALAACKSTPDPVTPPANAAGSVAPRFDGLYLSQNTNDKGGDAGVDLLRFTAAGKAYSLSTATSQSLESAAALLMGENERCAAGTYAVVNGILRFTLKSKTGDVEYAGAIKDDKLAARWRSQINGASVEETYSFVRVVSDSDSPSPERAAPDDADAGATAAPVAPATPELTLIPDGAAWFCFRAANASRCERKQAVCESSRKTAAAFHKDQKVGKCAKQPSAYCYTIARKDGIRGAASCSANEADCKAEAASLSAEEGSPDLSISVCAKQ